MSNIIRLTKTIESQLQQAATMEQTTKTELIKRILMQFLNSTKGRQTTTSPYELGKEYFGKYGSGRNDLSANRKKILKGKIRGKSAD